MGKVGLTESGCRKTPSSPGQVCGWNCTSVERVSSVILPLSHLLLGRGPERRRTCIISTALPSIGHVAGSLLSL